MEVKFRLAELFKLLLSDDNTAQEVVERLPHKVCEDLYDFLRYRMVAQLKAKQAQLVAIENRFIERPGELEPRKDGTK